MKGRLRAVGAKVKQILVIDHSEFQLAQPAAPPKDVAGQAVILGEVDGALKCQFARLDGGSLGIRVVTAQKSGSCLAKSLKILGRLLNGVLFSREFPKSQEFGNRTGAADVSSLHRRSDDPALLASLPQGPCGLAHQSQALG